MSDSANISRLERADTLGLAIVRSVIILNGGAILALLAFVSNTSDQALVTIEVMSIKYAIVCFLIGIVSILMALLVSYSYTATSPDFGYHHFWNKWIISFNSVLVVVSLVAFTLGVLEIVLGTVTK